MKEKDILSESQQSEVVGGVEENGTENKTAPKKSSIKLHPTMLAYGGPAMLPQIDPQKLTKLLKDKQEDKKEEIANPEKTAVAELLPKDPNAPEKRE